MRKIILVIMFLSEIAHAGATESQQDHAFVLGIGGTIETSLPGSSHASGFDAFAESTVIEDWLELELGLSRLSDSGGGTETSIDFLFKKPYLLSQGIEFMAGLGPELVRTSGTESDGTFWGVEFALDFMFWPWKNVGFSVEPTYDLVFRDGVDRNIGVSGGLIFGW
jgi:hypothetical protein